MNSEIDNPQFRALMFNNILDNPEASRELLPYIKEEYFSESHEKQLWKLIEAYHGEYGKAPNRSIINVGLASTNRMTPQEKRQAQSLLERQNELSDLEWLKTNTEKWCKVRACYNAVIESMMIIDGKSEDGKTMEAMPDLLSDAVAISFDKKIGLDFFADAEERFDMYHKTAERIPTGVDHLDELLSGGFARKTLNVFMAGLGVGKSLTMCHCAASCIKEGYNALYISMEMAEHKITERIDQNLLQMGTAGIKDMQKETFVSRFAKMQQSKYGDFMAKEYGSGSASIVNFRVLLNELKSKKNFVPDIIFIDYLNICGSSRAGRNAGSYEKVKHVAEELRTLAFEYNVPIVTATQTNRGAQGSSDIDLQDTSESIGVPQTADAMFALSATDEMRNSGLIKCTTLKNRDGDLMYKKNHMIGVEYGKMTLFDLDEQPAHIEASNMEASSKEKSGNGYSDKQNALFGEPKVETKAVNWG